MAEEFELMRPSDAANHSEPKRLFHHHSSPNCGHRAAWTRLHLRAWGWARWRCEFCGTDLCFDSGRRLLCAFLFGAYCSFLGIFVVGHVQGWVWIAPLCIGSGAVTRFKRIGLARAPRRPQPPNAARGDP